MRRDVFQAIADPTRRQIIDLLANKQLTLNAVADKFTISRPAISKQIKILTECGLITVSRQGREHYCTANLKKMAEAANWIEKYRVFWTQKLDTLGEYLEQDQQTNKNKKNE